MLGDRYKQACNRRQCDENLGCADDDPTTFRVLNKPVEAAFQEARSGAGCDQQNCALQTQTHPADAETKVGNHDSHQRPHRAGPFQWQQDAGANQ